MSFDFKRLTSTEINIGEKEKKIRLYVGAAALFISLFTASIILLVIGVMLVATGYSRVCPAYSAMDKNTLETETKSETKEK
ncbi:MAG: DUF2892 domain-containing protein [Methylococcales bacterium]|nr:DUF2892 domain-containing protein [Methylococcales bacterium]